MRMAGRAVAALMTVLFAASTVPAAALDNGSYAPVIAKVEVEGSGTFTMTRVDADSDSPETDREITIDGAGTFELSFDEPGDYHYLLCSKDSADAAKWDVIVTVTTDETDKLSAAIVCYDSESGEKPDRIRYDEPDSPPDEPPDQPPDIPSDKPSDAPPAGHTEKHTDKSVRTGDASRLAYYGAAMAVSIALLGVMAVKRHEKKKESGGEK